MRITFILHSWCNNSIGEGICHCFLFLLSRTSFTFQTNACVLFLFRSPRRYYNFFSYSFVLCSRVFPTSRHVLSPHFVYDAFFDNHLCLCPSPSSVAFYSCLVPSLCPAIDLGPDPFVGSTDLVSSLSRISRKSGRRRMACGLVNGRLCGWTHSLDFGTRAGSCSSCLVDSGFAQRDLQTNTTQQQLKAILIVLSHAKSLRVSCEWHAIHKTFSHLSLLTVDQHELQILRPQAPSSHDLFLVEIGIGNLLLHVFWFYAFLWSWTSNTTTSFRR